MAHVDNVIIGLGVVAYEESLISGVRLWLAPVEDFAYTLGAVMLVPTLYTLLTPRKNRDTDRHGRAPHGRDRDGDLR